MPAYSGNINDIYFFTIGLYSRFCNPNRKLFFQSFFFYFLIKFLCIIYSYTYHKIFCKLSVVVVLQYEFAAVSFKTCVISSIPIYFKS